MDNINLGNINLENINYDLIHILGLTKIYYNDQNNNQYYDDQIIDTDNLFNILNILFGEK